MFWTIGINFGLRGGQEHRDLCMENFRLETADNGEHVLVNRETVSKTYRGGLDHRNIEPHMARAFENRQQPDKCPVHIFKTYIQKLPLERAKEAFYFQPLACYRDKPIWFSKQPVGKNKLEVVVKTVMGKAGIDGFYTNHSLRATTATLLFNANIPEQLIREQTGHRSNALWSYSRPSEPQKRKMSEILQLNEDSCTSIGPTVSKQATTSSSPTAAKQATNTNVPIVSNPATTINAESVPSNLQRLKSAEEKLTKLREQTLHIKQFSSDIQVFLGTYQGNKSIVSETKSIKETIDASKDYELKVDLNSLITKLSKEVQDFGQIKVSENS
ncbi:unnamed protein product [Mytilus coruscus]|uniref:ZMYM2-like/QRICH1 C-terminal domain-containing protein n=1 Tax=Mytilus coruscus TaxID=42192 RepID=A0A6J8CHB4_MYTCO|nr:unnamed protein product [Mytilus coruscus]